MTSEAHAATGEAAAVATPPPPPTVGQPARRAGSLRAAPAELARSLRDDEQRTAASVGSEAGLLRVDEEVAQLLKADEDEQRMASSVTEVLVPITAAHAEDAADLLVAVAAPRPRALRALEQASAATSQHIGVKQSRRSCVKFIADMLDITAEEHMRRHNAYKRARAMELARLVAAREAQLGSLMVLPGLWCLMGLLIMVMFHSGGSTQVVATVWGVAGLVAVLLMSLRAWRTKAVGAAPQPVSTDALAASRKDPKLAFCALWTLSWAYAILVFLVPATAMVEMNSHGAQAGAYLFLFALWFAGWSHHGFSRVAATKVEDSAMMPTMPDGLTFRLRLFAVMYDGYVACGFSFFPALPWSKTSVPSPVIQFFEAGSFDFGVRGHEISFLMACATVPAAFAALAAVQQRGGREQFLTVVDVFFDALMFPVSKQLIGVLTCTRGNLRETTSEVVEGDTTVFTTKRVCGHSVPFDASCMDGRPDVECWSAVHRRYVLATFFLLVPYYVGGMKLRTEAHKLTSTVVIDGVFSVLAFQITFLLAVITSGFGDCHPWLVVFSVEISMIAMLVVTARRNFSNVLQLTALRAGGLAAASLNGFVAAYVAWRIAPDSCTEFDNTIKIDNLLPDEYGTRRVIVMVRETRDSGGNVVSSSTVPADAQPLHEIDASGQELNLTQDYSDVIALVSVNVLVLLAGLAWYHQASTRLTTKWQKMGKEELNSLNQRVDYPIVRKRLLRLPDRARTRILSSIKARVRPRQNSVADVAGMARATGKNEDASSYSAEVLSGFMMCASEQLAETRPTARAAGKQLEDLTIELLLFTDARETLFLKHDSRVFFFGLDIRTVGCERLMRHLKAVLEDALAHDSGCLNQVTCGHFGRQQIVAHRTVGVQFAPKPLGLANSRRWAENVEELLCFLAQVPQLNVIDLQGTGYSLELLALGACDPVGRSNLLPATLSYVVAGTSIQVDRNSANHLPADASGNSMGYDEIPATVQALPSALDALVLDFMNPSAEKPAVIGTRSRADASIKPFAQIYSEFCDLFAEGCLQWKVAVLSKLSVFANLNEWMLHPSRMVTADLNRWIAQIMKVETGLIVDSKFEKESRSETNLQRVRWSLSFRVQQPKMNQEAKTMWHTKASFDSAAVLSNFIQGFLQSRAIRKDHKTEVATKIAHAWRDRMRRRNQQNDKNESDCESRPRRLLHNTANSTTALIRVHSSAKLHAALGRSVKEDAALEDELNVRVRNRQFSRTDKFKALRQMVARRVPGSKVLSHQFDMFQKRAGRVTDLVFTCIDVRSKDLGPWHVALIAAWASHHPEVSELRLGDNGFIGQDGKPDLFLDPWCRTVKRLAVDAQIRRLDVFSVGMGAAGLLALTQSGLLGQLTSLDLSSNPITGDGKYQERQRIASVSERKQYQECADVWADFCEAVCQSNIAVLNLSDTGLVPHSLSIFSDSLHRHAEIIAKHGALGMMVLANNDLTAEDDVSGLAIFLVSASSVRTLDISASGLEPGCAEAIAHELSEMLNLTSLNIAGNNLGVDGAVLMAHKLQQHSRELDLLLIGDASKPIAVPFNRLVSDELDWSKKGLGSADAVLFSALLPTLTVAKINLSGNELGCVGKAAIAAAIRNSGCPIQQLRIDLGRTATLGGVTITISQTSFEYPNRNLSPQDMYIIAGFLQRQPEIGTLDLSDNTNLLRPQDDDVEQWDTMHTALNRTIAGKKHNYHLCQSLFATNQEFLWNDHDLQSWKSYTKQLLGDAEEDMQTGCKIAKPCPEFGKDMAQHAWWRLCQSIWTSKSGITDLRLSNIGLTPAYLLMLADGFSGGSYTKQEMRTIDLHKNRDLTGSRVSEQTDGLDELLSRFGTIAELNVSDCGLGNSGAKAISKHLHKISALNIADNAGIEVKGASFIGDSVITTDEQNCTVRLRVPGADDSSLTSHTRLSLFSSRKRHQNRNLARLGLADDLIRLDHITLGLGSVGEIKTVPFYQSTILLLSFARAGLRDCDAVIVASALSTLRRLREFDIHGNKFGAEGKEALASTIQNMGSLHTLIMDIGAHAPTKSPDSNADDAASTHDRAKFKLSATVIQCENLPRSDIFGKNDVYVGLAAAGQSRKTKTLDGAGANPVWCDGDGEELNWNLSEVPDHFDVTVWDEDVASADDLIGQCQIPLKQHLLESGWVQEAWFQLEDSKGRSVGRAKLRLNLTRLEYRVSTSEDDDEINYAELRTSSKPENPYFIFGGDPHSTDSRDQIDLSHMDLRPEDLAIVASWLRAPRSQVRDLNLSHNERMLSCKPIRAANGSARPVSGTQRSAVHQTWGNFCGAIRRSNVHRLALRNVGLTTGKKGQDQWCMDPLVSILERTATLRILDISDNFVLRKPCGSYFDPSDEEKLEWEHADVAKRCIAQAMIRRSEGWLADPPLETCENSDNGENDTKQFAMSKLAEAMGRLQQDKKGDKLTVEYKKDSKPAYYPLEELTVDLGAPSSKQSLTTSYEQQYKGTGKIYAVAPSQNVMLRNCSLRADDAVLLAGLITVWNNSHTVNSVHLDVADNMLGLSGRKSLIDAFTRGPRSTFAESAKLVINVGRWKTRGCVEEKGTTALPLAVPFADEAYIKWNKGFGQKQLALLSAWLREAVAHEKSRICEIDLSLNPNLGWWDLKDALISCITARDKRQNRKGLTRMALSSLNAIVYDQEQLDAEVIDARIVEHIPELKQMPPNLRHGLDRALIMLSQCQASAKKVKVLKLNGCNLNPARLKALSEAIRPETSTSVLGFLNLSELHLENNPRLVPVAGKLAKHQSWDHICRTIAHTAQHHQLKFVSFSGCRLSAESVAVLSAHLTGSKSIRRLYTLDVSNNDTLTSKGGKCLADALVTSEHSWPVVEVVLGHGDTAFLTEQQSSTDSVESEDAKSEGRPQSNDKVDQEIEVSNTLPLEKQRQIEQKEVFRPLIEHNTQLAHGRVLNMECKGVNPGLAWMLGEWLDTRDRMFSGSEHADMTICCLRLRANPLTGSKLRAPNGSLHRTSAKNLRSVGSDNVASWKEAGGVIDEDLLGFGKLCEAFGLPSITDVDLSYCGLGAQAMHEMTKSEHKVENVPWLTHAQLLSLNLSRNPLGVEGREYLRKALCDADIQHLTVDIGGKPKLLDAADLKLDFSQSHELTAEDAIVLAGWITVAPVKANLVELDVSDNDLFSVDCNGFVDLMEAVPHTCITALKMSKIGLNAAMAHRVAEMIVNCVSARRDPKDRSLTALNLSGNSFAADRDGNGAFRAICEAIEKSTIADLDFSYMKLSSDMVEKQLRRVFMNINPLQIKQVNIIGNEACLSDHTMNNLVAANNAFQSKLFYYKNDHKLTLNDTSQAVSRYQNWDSEKERPLGRAKSEPNKIRQHQQQQDSGKERPQLGRAKSEGGKPSKTRGLRNPPAKMMRRKSTSAPKLQVAPNKNSPRPELKRGTGARQLTSDSGVKAQGRQSNSRLKNLSDPLANGASVSSPRSTTVSVPKLLSTDPPRPELKKARGARQLTSDSRAKAVS